MILVWAGLFSLSWDRFANIPVGSFNLKLPVLAFVLAFVAHHVDEVLQPRPDNSKASGKAIRLLSFLILGTFAGGALLAQDRTAAVLQTGTVLAGALIPMLAISGTLTRLGTIDQALSALIRGGYFAAIFGHYQLVAFYFDLPQVVEYRAIAGGLGRMSSFSYEAGYFGYYLILVLAALLSRAARRGDNPNLFGILFLLLTLLLVNSRAVLFTLPMLALLVLLPKRQPVRRHFVGVSLASAFGVTLGIVAFPSFFQRFAAWAATVTDPTEASSNAPRLEAFRIQLSIIRDNWIQGIGPGNLAETSARYGSPINPGWASNEVVANNAWLQALLDGGVVLLVLEVLLVGVAVWTLYRKQSHDVQLLMAGWLCVTLISNLVTSFFFDVKLWAVLGLALAMRAASEHGAGREGAQLAERTAQGNRSALNSRRSFEASRRRRRGTVAHSEGQKFSSIPYREVDGAHSRHTQDAFRRKPFNAG